MDDPLCRIPRTQSEKCRLALPGKKGKIFHTHAGSRHFENVFLPEEKTAGFADESRHGRVVFQAGIALLEADLRSGP